MVRSPFVEATGTYGAVVALGSRAETMIRDLHNLSTDRTLVTSMSLGVFDHVAQQRRMRLPGSRPPSDLWSKVFGLVGYAKLDRKRQFPYNLAPLNIRGAKILMCAQMESVIETLLDVLTLVMRSLGSQLRNAGYNLAPGHFRILGLLAERQYNLGELAELQAVSAPTMSNSVTTLETRGWVRRVRDPEDRRRVVIELTGSGQMVLVDIRQQLLSYSLDHCPELSEAECERVLEALALIRELFPEAAD